MAPRGSEVTRRVPVPLPVGTWVGAADGVGKGTTGPQIGVGVGVIYHDGRWDGVGIGFGIVGDDCPLYCEIKSLLLIAAAGKLTIARITTILITRCKFFMVLPPPSKGKVKD